jgi:leader peptidase (prepilin peptidase)/N-methyltransferase
VPLVAAALGLAWGLLADRVAARWPAHDDGSVRPVDWRTPVVAVVGAIGAALLVDRFASSPAVLALLGLVVAGMIVMFATDLDQRLLPDVLTLPLALVALVAFAAGIGPFVRTPGELLWAVVAAIVVPVGLYALSIPFGAGAIGIGDLKLLFGVGLLAGAGRLLGALVLGAILAAVAIVGLLAARRITLRTYIPYGPFLILGSLWAILRANF